MIFSFPFTIILVDKKNFKQNPVQNPIIFPPKITILLGNKKDGKKNNEISAIPLKKKIENIRFMIIL